MKKYKFLASILIGSLTIILILSLFNMLESVNTIFQKVSNYLLSLDWSILLSFIFFVSCWSVGFKLGLYKRKPKKLDDREYILYRNPPIKYSEIVK